MPQAVRAVDAVFSAVLLQLFGSGARSLAVPLFNFRFKRSSLNSFLPSFLLLGARSSRMSCRHPNIQNIPRDPAVRASFMAPEGYKLVAADFAQIELRIAGLLSQDPVILSAYENGRDLHRAIVAQVTGKSDDEITIEERKLGKALNFGLLYGASAGTFQIRAQVDYGLDISLGEAQRFKTIFDRTYSRLRWWQLEQHWNAQITGKFTTVG